MINFSEIDRGGDGYECIIVASQELALSLA